MAGAFSGDAAELAAEVFADLGEPVRYTAGAGAPVTCQAIPRQADATAPLDAFVMRTLQTQRVFDLLRANVGSRPLKGDTIEWLDAAGAVIDTYNLSEVATSEDRYGLIWTCPVGEPT